jgi:hypothetical protein
LILGSFSRDPGALTALFAERVIMDPGAPALVVEAAITR